MKTLVQYAMRFVGKPYIWGGDDPMTGWDCSGLAQELLASVGLQPKTDTTAQGLYSYLLQDGGSECQPRVGAFVFFGSSKQSITHIGFCIDGIRMIEAGGGGSKTIDIAAAKKMNAYVRIRPVNRRKDLVACVLPDYPSVGIKVD